MIRALPWVAAFLAPALFAGSTYWVLGATVAGSAIGGTLAGVLGLSGAAMYWATDVLITRHRAVQEVEIGKLAAGVLHAQLTLGGQERIVVEQDEGLRFYPATHEGTARMHDDIWAEQARYRLDQDHDDGR